MNHLLVEYFQNKKFNTAPKTKNCFIKIQVLSKENNEIVGNFFFSDIIKILFLLKNHLLKILILD